MTAENKFFLKLSVFVVTVTGMAWAVAVAFPGCS